MKEQIIDILSERLDANLVVDLVNSYVGVKDNHIKGDDESSISKAGKFVENVFRVLQFVLNGKILSEIKPGDFNQISEDLRNANGAKFPESIRILVPKIALSLIYEPRNKSGAVHQKPINPDFIDSKLVVSACDWIIAELLRIYYTRNVDDVRKLLQNVVKDYIPIIQTVGNEKFVSANVACKDEIMIRLSDADSGLSRTELGESMKQHFGQPSITKALKKLITDRDIFLTKSEKYVISDSARRKVATMIVDLTGVE